MEFTDRLMATDRAVSSYIRFAGEPHPSPSETAEDMLADLLHWHERFVISNPPMSKREVRRMVNAAVKKFYEEREATTRGERPLDRARRTYPSDEELAREAARIYREQQAEGRRPLRAIYQREAEIPLPAYETEIITVDPAPPLEGWHPSPLGCDHCGRVRELYHNDATGLSLCEECDSAVDEEAASVLDVPADTGGDDRAF